MGSDAQDVAFDAATGVGRRAECVRARPKNQMETSGC